MQFNINLPRAIRDRLKTAARKHTDLSMQAWVKQLIIEGIQQVEGNGSDGPGR